AGGRSLELQQWTDRWIIQQSLDQASPNVVRDELSQHCLLCLVSGPIGPKQHLDSIEFPHARTKRLNPI
ncbi:hypothetical protein, partial [Salipiger aestuarii]|uniref:hypothetical protein n=1 Tax=Salipiger aestuarii TaxID=568098 RepID=UPI001CC31C74